LPLKICIAASGLGHVARGIEAWAADLGAALAGRGLEVTLCKGGGEAEAVYERVLPCWQRDSARTERLLRRLPRRFFWRLGLASGYGIEQTTFAWSLIRHLRRERIDILHVQDPQVAVLVERAHRLGLVGARTILAHGTEEPLDFQRRITYLQHLAPWHLDEARAAGVWRPTWTAIPNFIDSDRFRPGPGERGAGSGEGAAGSRERWAGSRGRGAGSREHGAGSGEGLRKELGIPSDAPVVLVAAAIKRQHKRIDYLLREFAALRPHPNPLPVGEGTRTGIPLPEGEGRCLPVWLVVAGGWEKDTDELVAEGKQLLGDRVRFLVRFPRERMPELYRAADLFVLCSLKEMMPIALLEAAASGLPCLVHKHPVMEWMIGPGGVAIDMTAGGALAAAMGSLLGDPARRRALGESARSHCIEHFGRDRVVDQILAYYEFVMQHDG
jgi:glycosyltransferase involved in cell wall biosynthesis